MNVSLKIEGADALLQRLKEFPKLQDRALVNAVNVLARAAQKEAKKGIVAEYNIKSRDLGQGVSLIPARGGASGKQRLFAVITARGKRIPLFDFGASPQTPLPQPGIAVKSRKPVTVKVLKKGGRHPVWRSKETGYMPFLATMTKGFRGSATNHTGIFVRTTKVRYGEKRIRQLMKKVRGEVVRKHQVIREVMAEGIPSMFMKIGGASMRRLVTERGSEILRQKIADQVAKRGL